MAIFWNILLYGGAGSVVLSALLLGMIWYNPRLMLQDYPKDVQQKAPPKTAAEKRLSAYLGGLFLFLLVAFPIISTMMLRGAQHHLSLAGAFVNAFGVLLVFNVIDWLILDWLIFCTITPRFAIISGTEGMPGYKNYAMHFRGFLIGTAFSAAVGLIIALAVTFL
jgi:uncharacterized membrane protein